MQAAKTLQPSEMSFTTFDPKQKKNCHTLFKCCADPVVLYQQLPHCLHHSMLFMLLLLCHMELVQLNNTLVE